MLTDNHGDGRKKESYLMHAAPPGASSEQLKRWSSPVMDAVAFFGLLVAIAVLLDMLFQPLRPKIAESATHNEQAAFTGSAPGGMACADGALAGSSTDLTPMYDKCRGIVDGTGLQPVVHRSSKAPIRGQ
jgi:hypothetical protein